MHQSGRVGICSVTSGSIVIMASNMQGLFLTHTGHCSEGKMWRITYWLVYFSLGSMVLQVLMIYLLNALISSIRNMEQLV